MRQLQYKLLIGLLSLLFAVSAYASNSTFDNVIAKQGISIGVSTAPVASAAIDINSITKGALLPRMTTVQRDAIVSPAIGLMIYNTDADLFNFYDGAWQTVTAGGSGDVVGPAGATDNALAVYDGVTGKLLKDSTLFYKGTDLDVDAGNVYLDTGKGAFFNDYADTSYGIGKDIGPWTPAHIAGASLDLEFLGGGTNGFTIGSSDGVSLLELDTAGKLWLPGAADITGSITNGALTASRALVTNGSKVLTSSATTATEIGFVSGVTSNIQTQINAISAASGNHVASFFFNTYFEVRAASTANVVLALAVENGDSFGGVTLATNDLVLLKDQTTATEDGAYTVNASGAPTRSTSYDTFSELNNSSIYVKSGTNAHTKWFQTATLVSLATNQVWANNLTNARTFTVPAGVTKLTILACGGGGGGGNGALAVTAGAGITPQGGSGGAGSIPQVITKIVSPTDVLNITLGTGGLGAQERSGSNSTGVVGVAGTDTTIACGSGSCSSGFTGVNPEEVFKAGVGGPGGVLGAASDNAGIVAAWSPTGSYSAGGGGGAGTPSLGNNANPEVAGGVNSFQRTASFGGNRATAVAGVWNAGGGGGGGAGLYQGARGGNGGAQGVGEQAGEDGYFCGGGGGGGAFGKNTGTADTISRGGHGGQGFVAIFY